MFRKILLLAIILMTSVFLMDEGFASVTYTPATQISLTGATIDVRFDVAEPLFGTIFSGAYLDTSNRNMSGAFYIQSIGWALMSSGSLQVALNCGAQPLSNLTSQCQFTGSGWSENIGEVGFANVRYNPSTATLSGSIASFAGNFSVEGIVLPLRMVMFHESLASITADHTLSLSIREPGKYPFALGGSWRMKISPASNPLEMRLYGGGMNGNFTPDVSLADRYTIEVTDPQGSITTHYDVVVNPGAMSQTYTPGHFAETFCSIYSGLVVCPDAATRQATTHQKTSSTIPIANGIDTHNFTLKLRDTYGNRVTTGTVEVSYTGTVSNIQLPGDIQSVTYSAQANWKDALVFNGDMFPLVGFPEGGRWIKAFTPGISDITYTLASNAPTDTSDNIVVLDKITYIPLVGSNQIITDSTRLEFSKAYTATLNPPTNLRVAASNVFNGTFLSLHGSPTNPRLITLFKIGDGNLARMGNLSLGTNSSTESPSDDWMIDYESTSHIIASSIASSFSLTGTYIPSTAHPEMEIVSYNGFIHFKIGSTDIVYPVFSGDKTAEYRDSKVKILGQNNARGEYGTISMNSNTRTNFVNKLRKNVTLMNRGRTSYTDVKYKVVTSDTHIANIDFDSHQTMIAIGADITITEDIIKRNDYPLAVIALTRDGVGGNINIDPSVKDVFAGLFAERAVKSIGDNQLYIYGAIVSGNTLGETAAGICPYYVTSCTNPEEYDLENIRTYDGTVTSNGSTNPRATEHANSALIIEYDMRLQTDPPPGLSQ